MSWTEELYKVYEYNCGRTDTETVMLPVSHFTANAQIEVALKRDVRYSIRNAFSLYPQAYPKSEKNQSL